MLACRTHAHVGVAAGSTYRVRSGACRGGGCLQHAPTAVLVVESSLAAARVVCHATCMRGLHPHPHPHLLPPTLALGWRRSCTRGKRVRNHRLCRTAVKSGSSEMMHII